MVSLWRMTTAMMLTLSLLLTDRWMLALLTSHSSNPRLLLGWLNLRLLGRLRGWWWCAVDLGLHLSSRGAHIDLIGIIGLHLDFVAGWEESVEADDEIWMAFEEIGDSVDNTWGVNTVGRIKMKWFEIGFCHIFQSTVSLFLLLYLLTCIIITSTTCVAL